MHITHQKSQIKKNKEPASDAISIKTSQSCGHICITFLITKYHVLFHNHIIIWLYAGHQTTPCLMRLMILNGPLWVFFSAISE